MKNIYTKEYTKESERQNNTNRFCPTPNETLGQACNHPAIHVTEDMIKKYPDLLCPTEKELADKGAQYCKPLPGCIY